MCGTNRALAALLFVQTRENHDKGTRHKMAYKEHFDKLKKEKIELAKADDEVLAELQKIERVTHTHHRTRTTARTRVADVWPECFFHQAANQQYAEDVTKGYAAETRSDPAQRQQYFFYGSGGANARQVLCVCVRVCARAVGRG